jgi:hypothetical protein
LRLFPCRAPGAPGQSPCLVGVGFPASGPQVWTFTSYLLRLPGALLAIALLWLRFFLRARSRLRRNARKL